MIASNYLFIVALIVRIRISRI